ncbi:hypothetical protein G9A89_016405, partial [Geosiphon pyriformis]
MKYKTAVYFSDLDLGIGIGVGELVSSTLAELQAIVLDLELDVSWCKIKEHSGVLGNECADVLPDLAAGSDLVLLVLIKEKYVKIDEITVSGNIQHIVHKVFRSVNYAHWEVRPGSDVFNKTLVSDVLSLCASDDVLYTTVSKNFLFKKWFLEVLSIFDDVKSAGDFIVNFVWSLNAAYHAEIWLVRTKYRAFMKRSGLISCDVFAFSVVRGLSCLFLAGVIKLLGIAEALS